jgi:murein peptide amidase A
VETLLEAVDALGLPPLGRSIEGRPIGGGRFGGPGAALLVFAGIHGDEPAGVEALIELLPRLSAGAPPAVPVWLLPAVNPDGVARGSKNSARDVDLNRNFPARSFAPEHAPGYYPGPTPLSEPETRVIADLVAREPIGAVVAVHAPFACVNFDGPAAAWADAVAAASGWPARGDIGYPTPGSLGSWLGVDRGLPVLTLELPPGPLTGFRAQAAAALDASIRAAPIRATLTR